MNKSKFLLLGAVAFGLVSNFAIASNNNEDMLKKNLIKSINTLVQEQYDTGFLKEKAIIKLEIIKPLQNPNYEPPENVTQIVSNQCQIVLAFDHNGYAPTLSQEKEIIEATSFKNEIQKEMMREFIILHENFHCEFANIENPIYLENKPKEFNEKINYYLKEMDTIPIEGLGQLGYIDTLAENFSDISAIALLIKKYGQENKDLQYVIKSIQIQRHAEYLTSSFDSHFTHIGIEKALSRDSLLKLINSNNGEEFKEIVLSISNKSVQKLMFQRKEMTERMFSENAFNTAIMTSFMKYINYNLANDKQKNIYSLDNNWKNGITRGFNAQFARSILSTEDIKQLDLSFYSPGAITSQVKKTISFVSDLVKEPEVQQLMNDKYKDFSIYMKEFKSTIYKQNQITINNFDGNNKEQVENKISTLKTKLSKTVNENKNNFKL